MAQVRIDKRDIIAATANAALAEAKKIALRVAKQEVFQANTELLETFLENEITAEIANGPNSPASILSKGNLFSFLGFEEGEEPIKELASFLAKSIKITATTTNRRTLSVNVVLSFPTVDDIEEFTELPWVNKSWVRAIEDGISGLGSYLYSDEGFEASRSESGIQASKAFSSQSFGAHKYLTEMVKIISKRLIRDIRAKCV